MRAGVYGLRVDYGVGSARPKNKRDRTALRNVTLEVSGGRVVALAGGDGAGKTSLLRALIGLVAPTVGEVRRPEGDAIGYLPASSGVYPDLTVDENLSFAAAAHGVRGENYKRVGVELLERTGLGRSHGTLGGALSGGMRQKLGVAMALVHRPDLLVLDEPSTGVDPVSRKELWRLIVEAAAGGAGVLFATTYLDEAGRSDFACVLDEGSVLLQGSPRELTSSRGGSFSEMGDRPDTPYVWRRGRNWRVWTPDDTVRAGARRVTPDLEDAVVVAALRKRERAPV
ncbi:MAG: ABC transporter ATP-binding protein [Actinomycetota bacterium]|nr:ABC transporter ATP-binding protein [Actinomycetota bacterium]